MIMKKFNVIKTDSTVRKHGYEYNVQVLIDGYYSGVGKFCRNKKEVQEYINSFNNQK